EDVTKERQRFTELNLSSEADNPGGMLLFPTSYNDIKQINYSPYTVDAAQMQLIHESVSNYFGVNTKVLQNSATPEELDAFFNGAIEPFAIQASEALSRAAFTDRERAQGSHITANADRLQYMTTREKVEMARQLGDRGAMTIDEIRKLFNYGPLPDGLGVRVPIRGEYYFVGEDKQRKRKRKGSDNNAEPDA
ncbi:MAG: phage portal protein, partial [Oscillibacter sp.]|nr:phage portal protein [Oscillibacter sp.]